MARYNTTARTRLVDWPVREMDSGRLLSEESRAQGTINPRFNRLKPLNHLQTERGYLLL